MSLDCVLSDCTSLMKNFIEKHKEPIDSSFQSSTKEFEQKLKD